MHATSYVAPMSRVVVIANAGVYVGPALARSLAARGDHALVLGDPGDALVEELTAGGTPVVAVNDAARLQDPATSQRLVDAALTTFGRLDAATASTGRIITGTFLDSTEADLAKLVQGCLVAPYHFLKAVIPPMVAQGEGQVLLMSSAAGARPVPGLALYSTVRAGAAMMAKNAAAEVARHGVQVNCVGTNFMDFPDFLTAAGAHDPAGRAKVEAQVPLKRLGTLEEFAAFSSVFLDGTSRFTTGQFIPYAGGWA
jgi:NAD(P)-dependent dehydrogenase (short-subunit alcohol dehydrogenase family)